MDFLLLDEDLQEKLRFIKTEVQVTVTKTVPTQSTQHNQLNTADTTQPTKQGNITQPPQHSQYNPTRGQIAFFT